jgi:hypothetical protein
MKPKLIIVVVICNIAIVAKGKTDFGSMMKMAGTAMKAVNTIRSKVAPPPSGQQQMAPQELQQQQQQYPQAPLQQPHMMGQQYAPQGQVPLGPQQFQNYPPGQLRAFNPKQYYKEFYSNEYQDRLNRFINRLTRIPNFLMSRKERKLLKRMKYKLCHEKDEDLEDWRDIEREEDLYGGGEDELYEDESPKRYKMVPMYGY